MALPPSGTTDEAFLREVDEEYRREQAMRLVRRYGRWVAIAVVVGLLALAAYLYSQHLSASAAGKRGEDYDAALRLIDQNQVDKAAPDLEKIATSGNSGYAAMARIALGNVALEKKDVKGAVARFSQVANDSAFEKPYRDLALIHQTAAEFDTLKPDQVIARLKPFTDPNSPWLGTAGEMVAAAYLKAGKRVEAGKLYGQIAQGGDKIPESIRQRAVQLAGVLGVDAIDQSKETKAQ